MTKCWNFPGAINIEERGSNVAPFTHSKCFFTYLRKSYLSLISNLLDILSLTLSKRNCPRINKKSMLDPYQFQNNNKNRTWWKICGILRNEYAGSRDRDDDFVNAINTRQLDRMSVVGGGQVKPVLLGYARAFWPPRPLASSPQRRPPSSLRRSAHIYRARLWMLFP